MRRSTLVLAASLALPAAIALPGTAHAQSDADRATARELGQQGERALFAKDYEKAEDRFRRADQLVHAPTLELGLARALAGEGKYVESQETYNRIVREGVAPGAPAAFKQALEDAKKEVGTVSPKVGGVTITVQATGGGDVPGVSVALDDAPVNTASLGVRRLVDPGPHVLRATAAGYKPAELRFSVPEGGSVNEAVTLDKDLSAPAPASVPAPAPGANATPASAATPGLAAATTPEQPESASGHKSILPWVAFGLGGAGLALGAVTGALAMSKHSDLAKACSAPTACPSTQQSNIDGYHTMGMLSTVGFVVGGVGVAAGAVLLLIRPKTESASAAAQPAALRVTPVVGPGSIGAVGTF